MNSSRRWHSERRASDQSKGWLGRLLTLASCLAIACAAGHTTDPALTITSPAEKGDVPLPSDGTVAVAFTVSDFTLKAPGSCHGASSCGHVEIDVDDGHCNAPQQSYNGTAAASPAIAHLTLCPVATGWHTIALSLRTDDGAAVEDAKGRPIDASVALSVTAPPAGGTPMTVASGQFNPQALVATSSGLVWANAGSDAFAGVADGTIMTNSPQGGSPAVLASNLVHPSTLALSPDGATLFYLSMGLADAANGSISRYDSKTGVTEAVLSGLDIGDGTFVTNGLTFWWSGSSAVMEAAPDGNGGFTTTQAAAEAGQTLIAGASALYYFVPDESDMGGPIKALPLNGGMPQVITMTGGVGALAVDSGFVYWTEPITGNVMKAPLSGGPAESIAGSQDTPLALAVDQTDLYWATASAIMRVSLPGGAPVLFESGQMNVSSIATDGRAVYWATTGTDSGDGQILMAAKQP